MDTLPSKMITTGENLKKKKKEKRHLKSLKVVLKAYSQETVIRPQEEQSLCIGDGSEGSLLTLTS